MPFDSAEIEQQTVQIADQLGEANEFPRRQIRRMIEWCGVDFVQGLLQETLTVEAGGGMMLDDGSRRRTPGGVFFFLARQRLPDEVRQKVFPPPRRKKKKPPQPAPPPKPAPELEPEAPPEPPDFRWEKRALTIVPLLKQPGRAISVTLRLIGRPDVVDTRFAAFVFMAFHHETHIDLVPKGLPTPAGVTDYLLCVRAEQWPRVACALADDPQDVLIAEGPCYWDAQSEAVICVAGDASTQALRHGKKIEAEDLKPHAGTLPFDWTERMGLLEALWRSPGRLDMATAVLTGRPWKRDASFKRIVIAGWEHTLAHIDLPGAPADEPVTTAWMAYIANKQWGRVADTLSDRSKGLSVQGYVLADPAIECLALVCTGLTGVDLPDRPRPDGEQAPASDPAARLGVLRQREDDLRTALDVLLDQPPDEQGELGTLLADLRAVQVEVKALLKAHPYLREG